MIWQLPELRRFDSPEFGLQTCVGHQCQFEVDYPKPTRLFGNIPGMQDLGPSDWPSFHPDGSYSGPLPHCGHNYKGKTDGQNAATARCCPSTCSSTATPRSRAAALDSTGCTRPSSLSREGACSTAARYGTPARLWSEVRPVTRQHPLLVSNRACCLVPSSSCPLCYCYPLSLLALPLPPYNHSPPLWFNGCTISSAASGQRPALLGPATLSRQRVCGPSFNGIRNNIFIG